MSTAPAAQRQPSRAPLALAYLGFIGLGLVSSRLGVTWPSIRASFGLPLDAIGALLIAQLVGSIAISAGSGRLTASLNIGVLSAAASGITAVALIGSGLSPSWELMIVLSALTGLGFGAIEASLNTYAASHFSPRAMNWLHASFGVGATLGPAILTALILSGPLDWRAGMLCFGVAQLALAIGFAATRASWQRAESSGPAGEAERRAPLAETLRLPAAWLGIALFVVSIGLSASVGQWLYSLLTEQRGVDAALAGTVVTLFWGAVTVGRILFGFVVARRPPSEVLRASMVGVLASAVLFWLNLAPWLSLASVGLLGLAMAPQFPLLISATPRYLGQRHAANGIGLQVAAAGLGGVAVTSAVGVLARALGLETIALALVGLAVGMVALFELLARHIGPEPGQG